MEIYLVRHTSVDIPAGYAYGQTDVPLRPSFEDEAEAIKKKLIRPYIRQSVEQPAYTLYPPRRLLRLPGRRKGRPH